MHRPRSHPILFLVVAVLFAVGCVEAPTEPELLSSDLPLVAALHGLGPVVASATGSGSIDNAFRTFAFNARLHAEKRPYLLIGVGRWGSTDPSLGIPVRWHQIAGARVIVEAGFEDFRVTPSQGTHFFQNLTSCNVGYFTVNPAVGEGYVDWDWLAAQPTVAKTKFARHVRLPRPLVVKMSGKTAEGVILKPDPE